MKQNKVVILDLGSVVKAGFGGDEQPLILKDFEKEDKAKLFKSGSVVDQGVLSAEISQIYKELPGNIDPSEHAVVLTELINPVTRTREQLCEILFEEFHAPLLWGASQPYLSFLSLKKPTGCLLECGADYTQIVCVENSLTIPNTANRIPLGGNILNTYIGTVLNQVHKLSNLPKRELIQVKEKFSYVVGCDAIFSMFSTQQNSPFQIVPESINLGGQSVNIANERFQFAEPLFASHLVDLDLYPSVSALLWGSLSKFEVDLQRLMLNNIVVTGGSTMIPGFLERFQHEFVPVVEKNINFARNAICVNISHHPHALTSAWVGASLASTAENFFESGVTNAEYMESGPEAYFRKCY